MHNTQYANRISYPGLEALAVTIGPGLIGSLLVGVETARTLAYAWNKPIIPVNHLKAHLYANFLNQPFNHPTVQPLTFPAIGLVVSGGHTDLVLIKSHGKIKRLGSTRDDAAGECFDKCSRLLGLGYPGGPAIEKAASKVKNQSASWRTKVKSFKLPRPMINSKDFDFSFSGLKTAVLNKTKKFKSMKQWNNEAPTESRRSSTQSVGTMKQLSFTIQEAITDCLVTKTLRAAQKFKVKSILIGGGVAANSHLRKKLRIASHKLQIKFFAPAKNLSTDNAAIIASCAYFNFKPVSWKKIKANPGLTIDQL